MHELNPLAFVTTTVSLARIFFFLGWGIWAATSQADAKKLVWGLAVAAIMGQVFSLIVGIFMGANG